MANKKGQYEKKPLFIVHIVASAIIAVFALFLTIGTFLPSSSSSSSGTGSENSGSGSSYTFEEKDYSLSNSQIKSLVETAIVKEVRNKYDNADPLQTRYSIGSTEKNGNDYTVYRNLTMYDKYGKMTTGWSDNSGSYNRSFEIVIKKGTVYSCKID